MSSVHLLDVVVSAVEDLGDLLAEHEVLHAVLVLVHAVRVVERHHLLQGPLPAEGRVHKGEIRLPRLVLADVFGRVLFKDVLAQIPQHTKILCGNLVDIFRKIDTYDLQKDGR